MRAGWRVERLRALSTARSEADVFVSADESAVIFTRTDAADGFGGDDLYMAFAEREGWSEAVNLGPQINTPNYEYGAYADLASGQLWFTSFRNGNYSIYTVPLAAPGGED